MSEGAGIGWRGWASDLHDLEVGDYRRQAILALMDRVFLVLLILEGHQQVPDRIVVDLQERRLIFFVRGLGFSV